MREASKVATPPKEICGGRHALQLSYHPQRRISVCYLGCFYRCITSCVGRFVRSTNLDLHQMDGCLGLVDFSCILKRRLAHPASVEGGTWILLLVKG